MQISLAVKAANTYMISYLETIKPNKVVQKSYYAGSAPFSDQSKDKLARILETDGLDRHAGWILTSWDRRMVEVATVLQGQQVAYQAGSDVHRFTKWMKFPMTFNIFSNKGNYIEDLEESFAVTTIDKLLNYTIDFEEIVSFTGNMYLRDVTITESGRHFEESGLFLLTLEFNCHFALFALDSTTITQLSEINFDLYSMDSEGTEGASLLNSTIVIT